MTRQAIRVVVGINPVDFQVRIVTRDSTDSGVVRVIALAICKPVWLKPNVEHADYLHQCNLIPGAVTLAAKPGDLLCRQLFELRHGRELRITLLDAR